MLLVMAPAPTRVASSALERRSGFFRPATPGSTFQPQKSSLVRSIVMLAALSPSAGHAAQGVAEGPGAGTPPSWQRKETYWLKDNEVLDPHYQLMVPFWTGAGRPN